MIMSTKLHEIYRCKVCGNVVEITGPGAGVLVCCGEPMQQMKENTSDGAVEKHVPVAEPQSSGILVKVGSTPHPMTESHFIEWIEVINGPYVNRCHLKPGDAPQAPFYVPMGPKLEIRAYCNLHGLWKKA